MTLVMVSTLIATEKVLILTLISSLLIMVPVNHTIPIIMNLLTIMMLIITTILIAISPVFHSITDMLGLKKAMVTTQELLTLLKTSTLTLSLTT